MDRSPVKSAASAPDRRNEMRYIPRMAKWAYVGRDMADVCDSTESRTPLLRLYGTPVVFRSEADNLCNLAKCARARARTYLEDTADRLERFGSYRGFRDYRDRAEDTITGE